MTSVPEGGRRAFGKVLLAMVLASALGYGVQLLAPTMITNSTYVRFTSFWSILFLGISAMSGVQNEIARASSPAQQIDRAFGVTIRQFILVISGGAAVVAVVAGTVLALTSDGSDAAWLIASLLIGLCAYATLATIAGLLYGVKDWSGVAFAIAADPVLRAVLFGVAALLALVASARVELPAMLLMTSLPFVIAALALWLISGRRVVTRVRLDAGLPTLLRNSFHTVLAATALGLMAAGMPFVIGLIGQGQPADLLAGTLLIVVLVRAPLISPMLALQSFLTVGYRESPRASRRRAALLVVGIIAVAGVLALVLVLAGEDLIALTPVQSDYLLPSAPVLIAAVASAALVAIQCVLAPALLATGQHRLYSVGWVVNAAAVVALALVPFAFDARLILTLTVPPVLGMVVHGLGLMLSKRHDGALS